VGRVPVNAPLTVTRHTTQLRPAPRAQVRHSSDVGDYLRSTGSWQRIEDRASRAERQDHELPDLPGYERAGQPAGAVRAGDASFRGVAGACRAFPAGRF
jgi:hypothetical protein